MHYTIGQVAKKLDVSIHTLRYYEKEKLLNSIMRDEHGNRIYSDSDIQWIYTIRCLRDTNMPIRNIKQYIGLLKQGKSTIPKRKDILIEFQQYIEHQILIFENTKHLLNKKIEYYANIEKAKEDKNNTVSVKCYDYLDEWEDFKEFLKGDAK